MTDTERGDSRNFSFFRWMHLDVERGPKAWETQGDHHHPGPTL